MADPTIGQGFNQDIATRYQPGQTQAEFYSQKTGQTFGNPDQLSSYVNSNYQGANATPDNVFGVLAGGYTPHSQALDQMKNDLNSYQNNAFNTPDPSSQRQSSSITNQIGSEQGNYNTYLQNYNDLQTKLQSLNSPNYQQSYNDLRTQQGVPGFEQDYLNTRQQERNLPYVNRAASGNAGAMTEGQLSADTEQKGIPLGIQESNLLDRLNLASQFINNSLNFKQLDYNASRQSLNDAINTAGQAINMSHTHLNDLLTMQQQDQARQQVAQQFAYDNRIAQPFYEIGGTVYRTSDRMPAHSPQEYQAMGGKGDFSDVQHVESPVAKNFTQIGSHVDQDGNIIPEYGFVNPVTGTITPYNTPSSPNTPNSVGPTISPNGSSTSNTGGGTLSDFITKYAPPSENNTTQYIQQISSKLGLNPNTPLSQIDSTQLATLIAQKESGTSVQNGKIVIPQNVGQQKNQLAYKNNNPGNLRYVGQAGATLGAGGFAKFSTPEAGWQALLNQVNLDKSRSATAQKSAAPSTQSSQPNQTTVDPTSPYFGIGKKRYDTVAPLVKDFNGEQQVKDFQQVADSQRDAQSLKSVSTATDSQRLIYDFAHVLNPSVGTSRQGVLDALQSGSNSIIQQFGVDLAHIFSSNSKLDPAVGEQIKNAIAQTYQQYLQGYHTVRNQYANQIDHVAGTPNIGSQMLPDYSSQPGLDPYKDYANSVLNMSPEEQYAAAIHQQINGGTTTNTPVDINKAYQSGGLSF